MAIVDNNGTDIHYEVIGQGPALVLQHGRLGRGEFWQETGYVEALGEGRTVILIDARGHGRSGKPHDPSSYHPRDMASDVIAVLDDVGAARADFFGYSMGGRLGFMGLTFFPQRFNSLIAGGAGPYGPAVSREAELALAETLEHGIEAYVSGIESMLKRQIPEADKARLLANDGDALAALAKQTADWPNVVEAVAAADLPILLFGGSSDPIWPLIEQANGQLSTSELHCFGEFGHGEDVRQPRLVTPVVVDFLSRHGLPA